MTEVNRTVDAVWKQESARIVAGLMRMVHDFGLAEELAQDALVAALEQWPVSGVPDNPGAWLTAIAKRRAVDHIRRARRFEERAPELARTAAVDAESYGQPSAQPLAEPVGGPRAEPVGEPFAEAASDDVLRLMFIACHPLLAAEARAALTLRVVAGLTAAEIARAFLQSEPAIAQRIAAAKHSLADARIPFELPPPAELADRLSSVLEVIYLIFNEGYSATAGDDLMRPELANEALRLGRLLAELAPGEPEVHGLVALMEIQASRAPARTGPDGEPVQLHEQNRGRWDQLLIRRGFAAMLKARAIGRTPGPYVLQAAIAVSHAQARTAADTDWTQIATLYESLAHLLPTPIVRLNQAVAVGMAYGPQAGLDLIDTLAADPRLRDYHLLPGVRGDLLARLGRHPEARRELERAATMARNAAESTFLRRRADNLPHPPPAHPDPAHPNPANPDPTDAEPTEPAATDAQPTAAEPTHPSPTQADLAESRSIGASPDRAKLARVDPGTRPAFGAPERVGVFGGTLAEAVEGFLEREDLGRASARSYAQTMSRLRRAFGDRVPLAELTADEVVRAFEMSWAGVAPATWNRHVAAARSFATWAGADYLAAGLSRQLVIHTGHVRTADLPATGVRARSARATDAGAAGGGGAIDSGADSVRAIDSGAGTVHATDSGAGTVRATDLWAGSVHAVDARTGGVRAAGVRTLDLEDLWRRGDLSVRERTLWRLLHESRAAVTSVLALNVEGLDRDDRRAWAGRGWVTWRAASALLLDELIAGRARGPVFLANRRPVPSRALADDDRCPETGRRRLSYERAEYLFKQATGGYTLRQLRSLD